jgi:hypothetical protein
VSVLLAGGVGAWLALAADEGVLPRANAAAGVTAALVLAAGLAARIPIAIPVAVALLGAGYAALLGFESETLDTRAPLVAAALFAVAELGYWSLELRGAVTDERGTYLRRLALLAASLAGVTLLGVGVLALVEAVETGGVAADLAGAAAAVGALALLALAAKRSAS